MLDRLLEDGHLQWYQQVEGTLTKSLQYYLPTTHTKQHLLQDKGNTVNYYQADYTNLRTQLDAYDVIVADFRYGGLLSFCVNVVFEITARLPFTE